MKLIFLLSLFFIMSLQPIFMVSSLIIITFVYSYVLYNMIGSYWYSYILLMVMLSGVLVIFTYMTTLVPNESFEMYGWVILFMFMMFILLWWNYNYMMDVSLISINLWISLLGIFNLFVISLLLTMMLMVIVLSYMNSGSFRI